MLKEYKIEEEIIVVYTLKETFHLVLRQSGEVISGAVVLKLINQLFKLHSTMFLFIHNRKIFLTNSCGIDLPITQVEQALKGP